MKSDPQRALETKLNPRQAELLVSYIDEVSLNTALAGLWNRLDGRVLRGYDHLPPLNNQQIAAQLPKVTKASEVQRMRTDFGDTKKFSEFAYKISPQKTTVHGNCLLATGSHDVYVLRNADTGELLHFGETGCGYPLASR